MSGSDWFLYDRCKFRSFHPLVVSEAIFVCDWKSAFPLNLLKIVKILLLYNRRWRVRILLWKTWGIFLAIFDCLWDHKNIFFKSADSKGQFLCTSDLGIPLLTVFSPPSRLFNANFCERKDFLCTLIKSI